MNMNVNTNTNTNMNIDININIKFKFNLINECSACTQLGEGLAGILGSGIQAIRR